MFGAELIEDPHRALAPREDREQFVFAAEIEPRDDAFMAMLDEETMRAVGERAHQFIFMGGQPEAFDIILVARLRVRHRSEEHTSELQSLMRISYAVFCLKKKTNNYTTLKLHDLN